MDTMKDTQMDLYPDEMVVPTMWDSGKGRYAMEWRNFIEWVHSDEAKEFHLDPLDRGLIY